MPEYLKNLDHSGLSTPSYYLTLDGPLLAPSYESPSFAPLALPLPPTGLDSSKLTPGWLCCSVWKEGQYPASLRVLHHLHLENLALVSDSYCNVSLQALLYSR
jgi:hypothetical protein